MIYATGDTHGDNDIHKLGNGHWPRPPMKEGDYLIILGDFGLVWSNANDELYWRDWLDQKPWTTLVVDGNHENHDLLYALPKTEMFGSEVGVISKKIFHLKRGHIYDIEGSSFFVMGGAKSVDKESRKEFISWWKQEIPSYQEFEYGLGQLEERQNNVDYIVAHTAPSFLVHLLLANFNLTLFEDLDCVNEYLEQVCKQTKFKSFYCGHWHEEFDYQNYHILYQRILKVC